MACLNRMWRYMCLRHRITMHLLVASRTPSDQAGSTFIAEIISVQDVQG